MVAARHTSWAECDALETVDNRLSTDAELAGELSQTSESSSGTNEFYLLESELGVSHHSIPHIVGVRAERQVRGFAAELSLQCDDASGIHLATVANTDAMKARPVWNWAVSQFPSDPVNRTDLLSETDSTEPAAVDGAGPEQAAVRLTFEATPEVLFKFVIGGVLRQAMSGVAHASRLPHWCQLAIPRAAQGGRW